MEIWDGYLADETKAGCDLIRGERIPRGLYHLVSEVLVRHADGDYLLMQRDPRKPSYGGFYEATAGGSALKGEDKISCARRELWEETGILSDSFEEIGHTRTFDTIFCNFLCVTDCDKSAVSLQAGETTAYRWVSEEDFIAFVNSPEMIDVQRERYRDYFLKMGYLRV